MSQKLEIVTVADRGLGNHSYLVGIDGGSAAVIDPVRDPELYHGLTAPRGLRVRWAIDTHLHADFVSGTCELAADGAQAVVPAAGGVAYPAMGLDDGGQVDLEGITLEAIATPGHTPEHLAFLLRDGATPLALFSGGALIPGGVARPDLLGPDRTEALARAAYRSLRDRLLALPDDLVVHPTHGAGSFCSAGSGSGGSTTIGAERAGNPLLAAADEDDFVARLLERLGTYPPYFLELREVNRVGPAVYGAEPPVLAQLPPAEVAAHLAAGGVVVDARPAAAFSAAYIPGSVSIPLRNAFAVWLGWLVRRDQPLVFVTEASTDRSALVRACLKIGYERLAGELAGGVEAWRAAGRPVTTIPYLPADQVVQERTIVDVRQRGEWAAGHVAGAVHVELGELAQRTGELAGVSLAVHCGHGERAMTAASLLARAGHTDVVAVAGGPETLARARGGHLEVAADGAPSAAR